MPVPSEYQQATQDFTDFLLTARDIAGLSSTHQAFTMAQGVFLVFRRRLSLPDAIRFACILPPGLRALFVDEWDPDAVQLPFASRERMTREVQALRPLHNFAPDTCIQDVAAALRRHVASPALDSLLASLPVEAQRFWSV
ncbi:MAG: DUF2267 domain-containing protein [Thermoanaerobaculia bacterium]